MRAGDVIASKYELVSRVGQGGMGAVWRVAHRSTGREFAIKFLHAAVATSEDSRQRFLQEAKASARINHPNIIDIFDVGETDDGTLYLVMELLDGISLGEALRSEPPFTARELLLVLAESCTALSAAHLAGVIHRDIKPPNIFLHRDRGTGFVTAKVLDFGVSKVLAGDDGVSTHTGSLLGSPRYMSPEQAHSAASADGRSDVWSIGVVLFEALTGRFPHDGDSSNSLVVAIATRPPKRIDAVAPHLPPALRLLVDDCLKPQAERIQSADAVLDRILAILATHDLSDIPLAKPTVAKGKLRVRPESFILRTSPESIPGLATSMMRARSASPMTRSGEMAGVVPPPRPSADEGAPIRRSAGEFSFGNTSTAETPRLAGRGAPREEEATLVHVVADPSTDTFRRPDASPSPPTVAMPIQVGAHPAHPASHSPPGGPPAFGAPALRAPIKGTLRLDDPLGMIAAAQAEMRGRAGVAPAMGPNPSQGTWMMDPRASAPDVAPPAPLAFDPTVESISSINVARGASFAQQEALSSRTGAFVSGEARKTRALWALLAGVAALTIGVSTVLVLSYARSGGPANATAASSTASALPQASSPASVLPSTSGTDTSAAAPPTTASPEAPASSSSPATSVSALPAVKHGSKPIVSGGRRPAKPGDPIKDLGSGLN